jgi:hypothetical protein
MEEAKKRPKRSVRSVTVTPPFELSSHLARRICELPYSMVFSYAAQQLLNLLVTRQSTMKGPGKLLQRIVRESGFAEPQTWRLPPLVR